MLCYTYIHKYMYQILCIIIYKYMYHISYDIVKLHLKWENENVLPKTTQFKERQAGPTLQLLAVAETTAVASNASQDRESNIEKSPFMFPRVLGKDE